MNIFSVTKDSEDFGIEHDYNVVALNVALKKREFVGRKLTHAQAVQLRQECETAQLVSNVLTSNGRN